MISSHLPSEMVWSILSILKSTSGFYYCILNPFYCVWRSSKSWFWIAPHRGRLWEDFGNWQSGFQKKLTSAPKSPFLQATIILFPPECSLEKCWSDWKMLTWSAPLQYSQLSWYLNPNLQGWSKHMGGHMMWSCIIISRTWAGFICSEATLENSSLCLEYVHTREKVGLGAGRLYHWRAFRHMNLPTHPTPMHKHSEVAYKTLQVLSLQDACSHSSLFVH